MTKRRIAIATGFVAAVALSVWTNLSTTITDGNLDVLAETGMVIAAVACFVRATRRDRHARTWLLVGAGLSSWTAGDLFWIYAQHASNSPPTPSLGDAFYLSFYPLVGAAIARELRPMLRGRRSLAAIVDAGIVALAFVALVAVTAFPSVLAISGGNSAEIATNLAYPVFDLLLIAMLIGGIVAAGRRPPSAWLLLAAGLALFVMADAIYLYQSANDTYHAGAWIDALWPVGALVMALGTLAPADRPEHAQMAWQTLAPIALAGGVATTIEVWDHFSHLQVAGVMLAAVAMIAVVVRLLVALRENREMAKLSEQQALTDSLTGLPNRRALVVQLDKIYAREPIAPRLLAMYDLNLFKRYNDTFGHAAGDGLLRRLAANLGEAIGSQGLTYRLGGDEFCVITEPGVDDPEALAAVGAASLAEHGPAFDVTASFGTALIPLEAPSAREALRLADERMYRQKGSRPEAALHQARDVLVSALGERRPELTDRVESVGLLTAAVARLLGMPREDIELAARAAELHDIGKVAIPDSVLLRRSGLSENDKRMLAQHPLIAERILGAAPALRDVAQIVRHVQEHYDGTGRPDHLAGEAIPLTARVVAVCAAYAAMTSSRPYREARSPQEALDELRRCAGKQFDPVVVNAFCAEAASPDAEWRNSGGSLRLDRREIPRELLEALERRGPRASG